MFEFAANQKTWEKKQKTRPVLDMGRKLAGPLIRPEREFRARQGLCRGILAVALCTCSSTAAQPGSTSAFGTSAVIPGGLRGDVYQLPNTTATIPDFRWLNALGSIYTNSLNVAPQSASLNWPGIKGPLD